jgi:tRNA/rRNA methyltransferase
MNTVLPLSYSGRDVPETLVSAVSPEPTFSRVRVVLCRPSHPGNIGAAARALKTMGFGRLVLVQPKLFPDPQAVAMASGAADVLESALVVDSLAEALVGTVLATALTSRRRELAVAPLWGRQAAAELAMSSGQGEVALVFGNETFGLSNDELALCARWAMIPANPGYASLNLAAAVQLMCYELRMALSEPGPLPEIPDAGAPASHDEVHRLIEHFERTAVTTGFLDPLAPKRFVTRLWRFFARARIEQEEISIFRGLLAACEKAASCREK